jgi:redox-sensitive bicupin YhaK (pirin superfamily)
MRLLRAADRFLTRSDGMLTAHCFSFGAHFDPTNTGFGALIAFNDEHLGPGSGYDLHLHRDTEIVTWVIQGTLIHEDSTGRGNHVSAGSVQRLTAGAGVRHAERNDSSGQPLRFVQMWLRPDMPGTVPTYACHSPSVRTGGWTDVVGGSAPVGVGTSGATLRIARLGASDAVDLPVSARCHVFVATGSVDVAGLGRLHGGDSLRLGGESARLTALGSAEVLAWELPDQDPATT